ncbi:MAG TPA: DUF488 domain-containing protein [Dehalococcoidia bacterium]|nr:DUF488 domain-containing protein [Dehalococcoidia bacterium]
MVIYSIGHSTRSLEELIAALNAHSVQLLADVRSVPRSRRLPHFNRESLSESLPAAGIEYRHLATLGGWRKARPDSPNLAWRSEGFRGYADYMLTSEFERALDELIELARRKTSAFMCAEVTYKRCHRMLIADALTVRGLEVRHILDARRLEPHQLTPFARVDGKRLFYPALI